MMPNSHVYHWHPIWVYCIVLANDACHDKRCTTFFLRFLDLGAQDLSRKLISNLLPDEKSDGLGTQQKYCKKKWPISHDFGLRCLVIHKPFQTKTAISVVAFVKLPALVLFNGLHRQSFQKASVWGKNTEPRK